VTHETAFERPRGVCEVELRGGYAQVHVSRLCEPLMDERLRVMHAIAKADISLDFLKLTPSGISFLVPEEKASVVSEALEPTGVKFSVRGKRSIVLVQAVNMRDEEGLIANIVRIAIASGAQMDHIGDMHDRVLIVVDAKDAEGLAARLNAEVKTA
jgi:aspartokinase